MTRLPAASYCNAPSSSSCTSGNCVLVAQVLQVRALEGLDEHRTVRPIELALAQRLEQPIFERQVRARDGTTDAWSPDRCRSCGRACGLALGQIEDLFERRDLVAAVVLLRARRVRLHRAQLLDLGEREVAREEAGDRFAVEHLRGAAIWRTADATSRRSCRRAAARAARSGDRRASRPDPARCSRRPCSIASVYDAMRVLGPISRSAAMRDHQRRFAVERAPGAGGLHGCCGLNRGNAERERREQQDVSMHCRTFRA